MKSVLVFVIVFALVHMGAKTFYPEYPTEGTASYYTTASCQKEGNSGVRTSNGEVYDENEMTCAMRRRDWGKTYMVTNKRTGKCVFVRHNDFGPNKTLFKQGRIIDLSKGAFEQIADLKKGIVEVVVTNAD